MYVEVGLTTGGDIAFSPAATRKKTTKAHRAGKGGERVAAVSCSDIREDFIITPKIPGLDGARDDAIPSGAIENIRGR